MAVDIVYNGSTIASLEGGQRALLACGGKKMKSDILVSAPAEAGSGSGGGSVGMPVIGRVYLPIESIIPAKIPGITTEATGRISE